MACDGALHYDIDAKEKWDKMERESRQQWEWKQLKKKGKEDTDAAIKKEAAALAHRKKQLEKGRGLVEAAIERATVNLPRTQRVFANSSEFTAGVASERITTHRS